MKILFLSAMFFSFSQSFAQSNVFELEVTRKGVKSTRIAYNHWSGEYPEPVIDVTKEMTFKNAISTLKNLTPKIECTIPAGLYHPWSNEKDVLKVVLSYTTLAPMKIYEALDDYQFDEIQFKKGDVIARHHYLSEGYCAGILKKHQSGVMKSIEYSCHIIFSKYFKTVTNDKYPNEQWINVKCAEGYNAFILDEDLLSTPGVKEGEIADYGSVQRVQ